MVIRRIMAILFVFFLLACSENTPLEKGTIQKIENANNEVSISNKRCVGQVCISAEWQRPEMLANKELKSSPDLDLDSLISIYEKSLSFVITLSPYKVPAGFENLNILKVGISDIGEYQTRVDYILSEMKNNISLKIENATYDTKLFLFENNMDLTNYSKFITVFSPEKEDSLFFNGTKLNLSFNDPFFGSGISHFLFDRTL